MGKFNLAALLDDTAVSNLDTMQVQEIELDRIREHPDNRYAQSDIEELAESIQVIGLQQPLVVVPTADGAYELLAGHRRRGALVKLERKTAPCIVLDTDLDPALRTLILHWTNTMARGGAGLTGSCFIAGAAQEIEQALLDLKARGVIELPGKLREHVAGLLQISESRLARAQAIDKHLNGAWKGDYQKKRINDSVAYELSQCSPELQCALHEAYKGDPWRLDAKDVKAHKKAFAAGFAPLICPAETYGAEPCVSMDKRAAAVGRGECPGCCHTCEKSNGCPWVCGRVSKQNKAQAEAEQRKTEKEQATAAFEASPLGALRRHLWDTLAAYGVHRSSDLPDSIAPWDTAWIWADDPEARSAIDIDTVFRIADHIGIHPQELLFGNPEGAPLRALAEGMEQAIHGKPCVTGLSKSGVCGAAQCCDAPYGCCIACPTPCNGRCGWLEDAPQMSATK